MRTGVAHSRVGGTDTHDVADNGNGETAEDEGRSNTGLVAIVATCHCSDRSENVWRDGEKLSGRGGVLREVISHTIAPKL